MKATRIVAGSAPASAPTPGDPTQHPVERELRIEITPRGCDEWRGTSAQLIGEGLVAQDLVWPKGQAFLEWRVGAFDFLLHRQRPDGFKGPMKAWLVGDNWCLRRKHVSTRHDGFAAARLYEKRQAYIDELRDNSPEGHEEWRLLCLARQDKAFKAFKAAIPALIPPKRGRKTGKSQTAQGVQP